MPEREGPQTIRQARKHRPGLKIVAISGSGGPHLHAAELMGADAVLRKPLARDILLQVVTRQAGAPAGKIRAYPLNPLLYFAYHTAMDPLLAWRDQFPILGHTTYMISHS